MRNQFGYETSQPNPPWHQRDVMNKCDCGAVWVGASRAECADCAHKAAVQKAKKAQPEVARYAATI